jgi:2-polyprenyl-3-methyl-5-hydroxy-6-metoxy-1,4-benzoquinol methylase
MNERNTILESWAANAEAWKKTIEGNEIESRKLVTNQAILETILEYKPRNILDIGCGEGWLTRMLRRNGVQSFGVDAIEALITYAIQQDGPYYTVGTYHDIAKGLVLNEQHFENAVINFALIDKEETEMLIHHLPHLLQSEGFVFIQTLHPPMVIEEGQYVTGWKEGSWNGMKQQFVKPYKWYFRTITDWIKLFFEAGFVIQGIREPLHPQTGKPASIIFVLKNK